MSRSGRRGRIFCGFVQQVGPTSRVDVVKTVRLRAQQTMLSSSRKSYPNVASHNSSFASHTPPFLPLRRLDKVYMMILWCRDSVSAPSYCESSECWCARAIKRARSKCGMNGCRQHRAGKAKASGGGMYTVGAVSLSRWWWWWPVLSARRRRGKVGQPSHAVHEPACFNLEMR